MTRSVAKWASLVAAQVQAVKPVPGMFGSMGCAPLTLADTSGIFKTIPQKGW